MSEPHEALTGTLAQSGGLGPLYDRTIETAFSLAYRITGDRTAAGAACEEAYLAIASSGAASWTRALELELLSRVRMAALSRRPTAPRSAEAAASYQRENAVREQLAGADPVGRRAIELCYFGGMTAEEAAGVLGIEPAQARAAMRNVLLALASVAREEAEEL